MLSKHFEEQTDEARTACACEQLRFELRDLVAPPPHQLSCLAMWPRLLEDLAAADRVLDAAAPLAPQGAGVLGATSSFSSSSETRAGP